MEQLIAAGANGVRINMSHGTHEEKAVDIERARAAAEKLGRPIAVLVDLSGPKIRTGELKDDQPVRLVHGAAFTLTTRRIVGDDQRTRIAARTKRAAVNHNLVRVGRGELLTLIASRLILNGDARVDRRDRAGSEACSATALCN